MTELHPMKYLDRDKIMNVLITSIEIPEYRQRENFGDISELAESFKSVGQIEPIVITKGQNLSYRLMAGHRRIKAALELGWDKINAVMFKLLPESIRLEIELEENIRRKDLSWDEKAKAVQKLHDLKTKEYGSYGNKGVTKKEDGVRKATKEVEGWSIQNTADMLGVSRGMVSQQLKLAEKLKENPELAESKNQAIALNKAKRDEVQAIQRILATRASEEVRSSVLEGNCLELIKTLESESVDMVLTDVPYDVDLKGTWGKDKRGYFQSKATDFDDLGTTATVLELRDELYRVMVEGSFLVMFCSTAQFPILKEHYGKIFKVRTHPIIWDKITPGIMASLDPNYQWALRYEIILWACKGRRPFNRLSSIIPSKGDVIQMLPVKGTEKEGINQKPVRLLSGLLRVGTLENELILDPFAGTGSTGVAAIQDNRRFKLFELNPEAIAIANSRLQEELDKSKEL